MKHLKCFFKMIINSFEYCFIIFICVCPLCFCFSSHRPFCFRNVKWNSRQNSHNLFFFIVFLYEIINGSPVNNEFIQQWDILKQFSLSTYFHKTLPRWKNKYVTMLTFILPFLLFCYFFLSWKVCGIFDGVFFI